MGTSGCVSIAPKTSRCKGFVETAVPLDREEAKELKILIPPGTTHSTLSQLVKESGFKRLNWHIKNISKRDDSESMTHIFTQILRLSTPHGWKQLSHPQHSKNQWKLRNGPRPFITGPSPSTRSSSSCEMVTWCHSGHLIAPLLNPLSVFFAQSLAWLSCFRGWLSEVRNSFAITSQWVCSTQKCKHVWAPINWCIDHHLPLVNSYWDDAP